jgi:hypothetical protein
MDPPAGYRGKQSAWAAAYGWAPPALRPSASALRVLDWSVFATSTLGELVLMGEGRSVQLQYLWEIKINRSYTDLWAPARPPRS